MSKDPALTSPAKFVAVLEYKLTSRALVPFHAKTMAEAEKLADEIHAEDVENWNYIHDGIQVLDVRPAGETDGQGVDNE